MTPSRRPHTSIILSFILLLSLSACSQEAATPAAAPSTVAPSTSSTQPPIAADQLVPDSRIEVLNTYPFDEHSFTQGLEMEEAGTLLVGTGQYGESQLYRRHVDNPTAITSVDLPPEVFGEGIAQAGDHIWQLTWRAGVAYKRDARTFEELGQAHYEGEGWGLCQLANGELAMSDGSATLSFRDADSFGELKRIQVTKDGAPVAKLNELECTTDGIYANLFLSNYIVRINPDTGEVTHVIDASGLPDSIRATTDRNAVLNGIALIPGSEAEKEGPRFLLAGKRWGALYEVRFVPQAR